MRYRLRRGDSSRIARIYAFFTVVAKWPQLLGMLTYYTNLIQKRTPRLIEYKGAEPQGAMPGAVKHPTAGAVGNAEAATLN
jgi:hypothetical protein